MRTLYVMVKEPRPGRVKTRLGRDIGMTCAAWWFRHQVAGLLHRVQDPRWQVVLAVSPDAAMASRVWPVLPRVAQGRGDLGDRMGRLFRRNSGQTCIIGADIPGIGPRQIAKAFRILSRKDAVFGPAEDGGYWLIGMKRRPPPGVFDGVRWSSEHALADTIATLPGWRIGYAETLRDVDTVADLRMTSHQGRATPLT